MSKDFNEFRFSGLHLEEQSNKFLTMNRVSDDENKVVVKVGTDHLLKTKYGFALILNSTHVVFLKDWQVDINYFGNEVLIDKDYFLVKQWGDFSDVFDDSEDNLKFEKWLGVAKIQQKSRDKDGDRINIVHWTK